MKSRQASAASTSTSRGRRRVARGVHRLAGAQQRLGRDARPVGALAPDQLALDERDAQAALGQRAGAVLARRAAADDDDVVVAAHVGSSSPACSAHHVLGVPVRPVRVGLAGALLVLAVRAAARRSALARSAAEANVVSVGVDAPGQPRRDLLEQPAVAVRVAERGERAVAGVLGRGAADATARAVGLEPSARRRVVEHLADLDAARGELVARGLDVGDDQVQALGRARRGRRESVPNWIEHPEPGGVNWTTRKSSPTAKSASSRQPRPP